VKGKGGLKWERVEVVEDSEEGKKTGENGNA